VVEALEGERAGCGSLANRRAVFLYNDCNEGYDWLIRRCKLSPLKEKGSRRGVADRAIDTMAHRWLADPDFAIWELDVLDRACACCGRIMYI
jgi:hypothetical protein